MRRPEGWCRTAVVAEAGWPSVKADGDHAIAGLRECRNELEDCVFADRDRIRPIAEYRFPQDGTLPRDAFQLVSDELMPAVVQMAGRVPDKTPYEAQEYCPLADPNPRHNSGASCREVESDAKPVPTEQAGETRHQPDITPLSRGSAPHSWRGIQDYSAFATLRVWIRVNGSGTRQPSGSPSRWSQSRKESRSA